MKECPTCGNKYRPDVDECPNDGTKLTAAGAPPAARVAPPPGAGAGPPQPKPPASKPVRAEAKAPKAKASYSHHDISTGLTEKSTASSWIFALITCGLLIGGYLVARDHMLPKPAGDEAEVVAGDDKPKKKGKKRRKKRTRRANGSGGEESFDDYEWEQDYAEDDLVLGDIAAQPDDIIYDEPVEMREPEPYDPKPNEWQSGGSYRPTASWSEPGARANVVEIDLSAPSNASPLDESQVKEVLSVRKLASCYDPWVQKIPQMKGRVHMTFVIAPDGHVASAEITRSQLRSKVVEKCIVKKARTFRFPRAQGGAKTRFDTHFDFTNR